MHLFERRPELLLTAITLLWGSTFVVTEDMVRGMAPLPYLVLRFGAAALVLGAIYRKQLARASLRTFADGAVLGALLALGLGLQVFGQVFTTASKSAFVASLSTALVPPLAFALHGEPPEKRQVQAVALASFGLLLLTWPAPAEHDFNRGDVLIAFSAIVYAAVIVETARRARRSPSGPLTTLQIGFAALLFLLALLLARALPPPPPGSPALARLDALERLPFAPTAWQWAQIAYMALACTVVTSLAQTWSMARMSAARAAVVFALEPVFATILAIAVEGSAERPSARGAVGASLILAGVVASEIRRRAPIPLPEIN